MPVFGFDYNKLVPDEAQVLALLDSFQLMKMKDTMEISNNRDKLLAYLGKDLYEPLPV